MQVKNRMTRGEMISLQATSPTCLVLQAESGTEDRVRSSWLGISSSRSTSTSTALVS